MQTITLTCIFLSTPHGTLGTSTRRIVKFVGLLAFNSTRYIRNLENYIDLQEEYYGVLSTPHGTLGTKLGPNEALAFSKLSTPHGTLGTEFLHNRLHVWAWLSTPHGTLGT